jgi:hypothetical protein
MEASLPPLSRQQQRLVEGLEVIQIERHLPPRCLQWLGRKRKDRRALARAFVAKALYNLPTTKLLVERLQVDRTLRQLCGWEQGRQVPSEATFSRAFAEFARLGLTDQVHAALVAEPCQEEIVYHISRDATEIEARESPQPKRKRPRYRRGRPKRDEVRPPTPQKRLARQ